MQWVNSMSYSTVRLGLWSPWKNVWQTDRQTHTNRYTPRSKLYMQWVNRMSYSTVRLGLWSPWKNVWVRSVLDTSFSMNKHRPTYMQHWQYNMIQSTTNAMHLTLCGHELSMTLSTTGPLVWTVFHHCSGLQIHTQHSVDSSKHTCSNRHLIVNILWLCYALLFLKLLYVYWRTTNLRLI